MNDIDNKTVAESFFKALGGEDSPLNYLAQDVKWTLIGTHRFAGVHSGKQAIERNLLQPIGEVIVKNCFTISNMIAEGNHVVVEGRGLAETSTGERYDNTYCVVLTVQEGLIQSLHEYMDTELVTRVFGEPG